MRLLATAAVILLAVQLAHGQGCEGGSCFPSTGDLLVGRGDMLFATSTCGRNGPETYCIVSHLKDVQKCFTCDAAVPTESHPVQNVITTFNDRLETWWQAENGRQRVSIQLDLEAEFQFTHVIMTFKTFRPAAMFIERSLDFGKTWNIYRYFAYDCDKSYPGIPQWPPREIDEVICDNRYSQIEPSNGGEVIYRVLEPFIHIDDPYAPRIQNLLKITNLRFNFTELHTLGDDLLDARRDIKSKYYYSLYELIVRGNCFCYGHADQCTPIHDRPQEDRINEVMASVAKAEVHGRCQCQHNTVGLNCEQCRPFYHDQPWRPAEAGMPNECQPCNCNNHATECHFDPAVWEATDHVSGGVCENCLHNTVGRNCEQCAPYFYQNPLKDIRDPRVCAECDCEVGGSLDGGICDGVTNPERGMLAGQCRCKRHVEGPRCDQCKPGYYGLDENNPDGCRVCDCDSLGTLSGANACDSETGQCICKRFTTGRRCDMCIAQTWGMSAIPHGCSECDCDVGGAYNNDCDKATGQCHCRPNINNRRCDTVVSGNFLPGLDHYIFEAEDADVRQGGFEDKRTRDDPPVSWTGDGFMLVQEEGVIVFTIRDLPKSMDYHLILRYQSNMPNEWKYVDITINRPNQGSIPTSSPCGNTRPEDDHWMTSLPGPPTTHHSLGIICLERDYTYRVIIDLKRYQREQNPDGSIPDILIDSLIVVPVHTNMEMFHGTAEGRQRAQEFDELECLDEEMMVPDRIPPEECAGLMFSMSAILHDGAKPCDCDLQGSESSICEDWGGQCRCKRNVIGRRCDRCAPGTYGFGPTGCRPCDCDLDGSQDKFCDVANGQCRCLPGVSGRRCDRCKPGHYQFPDCPRCSCNGHAETCDQDTGVCLDCRGHTVGSHCETCDTGYYGNPVLGSVDQCKPCLCPDGPESNRQFASGCRFDKLTGQVTCYCNHGYTGPRCDRCAPAFWGNPHEQNGLCRECECNGNVDPLDPGACDATTGVCTGCLYDTAGPHCERCRDYFYGSAFDNTCTACACNLLGTDSSYCDGDECRCDVTTGQCPCLPNVSGRNCDQCEPNHWRLASGEGCESCDCNEANSNGPTCNEFTGQCQCVEGFGGRTCNDCADGHFGDPNRQCFSCDCDRAGSLSSQCDSRTGQCECKEGVGGRKCSLCLRGHTGEVPNCQPCGECFDNWDKIIMDLKNKTQALLERAKEIGKTGINAGFDDLKYIADMISNITIPDTMPLDNVMDLIRTIEEKLSQQEERLKELEDDMDRIRDSDKMVNDDMEQLNNVSRQIHEKLDQLKNQKQNISRVSPVAAFKQISDAATDSANAEREAQAATTDPGSLVEQSKEVRERVESEIEDKQKEFDDELSQVEQDLADRKSEVDDLTFSKLNADMCGKPTEGCDETCGGAGCDTCGGIGCNGAVQLAKDAKDRAQKTQEILTRVADETSDLRGRVKVAKENAQDAKSAAQAAKNRAQEVEGMIRQQNSEVRNLIRDIRKFLSADGADPKDIETVAKQVLALKLPIGRDEIDELARNITYLVNGLPNVDDLLQDTQDDLRRAEELLDAANQASAAAASVAGDIDRVMTALEEATNASARANEAKNKAIADITLAEGKINDIQNATGDIVKRMTDISGTLEDFDKRLKVIENQISANSLDLNDALSEARSALDLSNVALEGLNDQEDLIRRASTIIPDKKNKTDRLYELRRNAENLKNELEQTGNQFNDISSSFDNVERQLEAKNDRLAELLIESERLYAEIKRAEEFLRTC